MCKKMKKIALLLAAVAVGLAAQAQVVVGLQGGYFQQKTNNPALLIEFGTTTHQNMTKDTVALSSVQSTIVGGLQVGYQVTPKIYVGIAGGIVKQSGDTTMSRDYILITPEAHSFFTGQWETVNEHKFRRERSGWNVAPQVKYEFARYGNMHFNLMLQADITSLGYSTLTESFRKPFENNNEYVELDPYQDSIKYFSWGVSLRPTLVYEFSQHLSAELSLDFLSIGYVSEKVSYEGEQLVYEASDYAHQNTPMVIAPHDEKASTFYAGLNTFMQALRWESPMLRLGFNWKF